MQNTPMVPPAPHLLLLLLLLLLAAASSSSADDYACNPSCGALPIRYPFGAGPGCGSPLFHPYVACSGQAQQLTFTSASGSYPIDSVDYANQILYLSDPSMSTCSATNPSRGFSLDWDAPFAFADSANVFALLDCSPDHSPLYSAPTSSSPSPSLCDATSSPLCGLLYTCPAISALGAPPSTCCVYTPASLGPAFAIDLAKLRCASYAGVYSFGGAEARPDAWKFGIALRYRFSPDGGFPSSCADCEQSGGVCGYVAPYNSFTCSCRDGTNSSTNCYFAAAASWSSSSSWSGARRVSPFVGLGFWFTCIWLAITWSHDQF